MATKLILLKWDFVTTFVVNQQPNFQVLCFLKFSTSLVHFSNYLVFQAIQLTIQFQLWRLLAGLIFLRLSTVHLYLLYNHLCLLALRLEEGGGTFLGSNGSPDSSFSTFLESDGYVEGCFGSIFPSPQINFQSQNLVVKN